MLTTMDLQGRAARQALERGSLTLSLGPFSHLLSGWSSFLQEYLADVYQDYRFHHTPPDVTEIILNLGAPNVFRRYVRRQVVPDPGFEVPAVPLPLSMAPLAFEMGLNLSVALKCCRFVTVHAGVVADKDGAIVMSASSGAGKSTLTAALMQEGYRLFSDEFALIDLDDAQIHPYPRPISLKQQSIDVVKDLVGAERLSPVISGTPKGDIAYCRPSRNDLEADQRKIPVKLLLFPNFEQGARPLARQLNPAEAIMRLIPASTNYSLLGEPAYRAVVALARQARAYEITYGTTQQSLNLIADLKQRGGPYET